MVEMEAAGNNTTRTNVLDYGRQSRYLTRRRLIWCVAGCLLALASVMYGPGAVRSLLHRLATWNQGRELATMTLPTTQPVLSGALSLSKYKLDSRRFNPSTLHQPLTHYDIWIAYAREPDHHGYVLFHELLTPSGEPRLLALKCGLYDFDSSFKSEGAHITIDGLLWIRGHIGAYPQGWWQTSGNSIELIRGTQRARVKSQRVGEIYAAVVDPNDRNRFTIRFTLDQINGMLEGRLQEDGKIRLRLIEGDFPAASTQTPR